MTDDDVPSQVSRPGPQLVGREREQRRLSALLDAALTGHGGLTLVSGEAGIGKTALVRDIAALATERGYLVLTGACYDSGTTPAYSLWRDLLSVAAQRNLPIPSLPANDDWVAQAATPEAVVTTLRDALDNLVERGPLLVILEDLHWADPESLAFLRLFARGLSEQRLLLVATYRDTELPVETSLDQTLPHLIHEANVERIALHPLDEPAIEALIRRRYALPAADQVRLTASLAGRSQGVPFYLIELLSTLEADQSLRRTTDGWLLGELAQHLVPVLVKQVIDARLSGLGNDARRLLELVAVVNQEAPLVLLRRLNGLDDDTFADALDEAMRSQLLITGTSSLCVQYTHALARDSLYAGIPLSRRQRWHRGIAEALAEDGGHPPDVIAHHFRQALDRRAVEWFIRAGSAVERVAWLTAASHFAAALEMLGPNEGDPQLRGWLLARRAGPLRNTEPRTSLALLATAEALAIETNDAVLYLYVTFLRGQIRCISGDIQRGLVDLETSVSALAGLSPADIERFEELEGRGAVASRIEIEGLLAAMLASVGRVDEALEGAEKIIRRANVTPVRAWWARAIALALAGRPSEASGAFFACGEALRRAREASTGATLILYQIMLLQIPYAADDLVERRRIVADGEMAWQYAGGALGEVSRPLIALQYLLIEGDWRTARELAALGIESADLTSVKHLIAGIVLARIAREQGETTLAWQLVHRILPAGPQTAPGHAEFATSRALMFTATLLSLDAGDIPSARTWLDAHDQWLKWNRTVLGQSENQLLWAQFYRAMGDLSRARRHATESLGLASDPRQPLALLASHRLCGELEATSGALSEARRHLDAALSLADACAARYERALTLLAIADLEHRAGKPDAASATLSEAHSIFRELKATPVLARAEALAAQAGVRSGSPAGGAAHPGAVTDASLRVDVNLLDTLMRLVGELVLTRNQIVATAAAQADPAMLRSSQRLNLLVSELQEGVMKTRMQPIDTVWNKLPRVIRDLGISCGKDVRIELEGRETELDKTILEAIKDPLTHVVRNAVDHGIETPDARIAAGKPAQGLLTLRAFHEGGQVNIEITDDGAGIDPAKVAVKALASGLVTPDQLRGMGPREVTNLIFAPGFSTAEAVTNVSGRGVGMDVVRTNIEKIGGTVDVTSELGSGTTLRIKIPLTLAIIPALTVECAGERYAVPQVSLEELLCIEGDQARTGVEYLSGAPVFRLRGNLLPLVWLDHVLDLTAAPHVDDAVYILVLQAEGRRFGLVVDRVLNTEEIVVKPLSRQLKGIGTYAGATILGDGRVALILDVRALARRAHVVRESDSTADAAKQTSVAAAHDGPEPLLVVAVGERRLGVPLSMVTRLEEIPNASVERVGQREVVQYRGQLLPLARLANLLGTHSQDDENGQLKVIVYTQGRRSVGLVVDAVVDIASEAPKSRGEVSEYGVSGVAVVQERVTELLDMEQAIMAADPRFFDAVAAAGAADVSAYAEMGS